jgi:hypothetical protein
MGFPFAKFFDIVKLVAPIILVAVPGGAALAPLASTIIQGIGDAEQLPGATSAAKKAYVMTLVNDTGTAIAQANPTLVDPVLLNQAAGQAIDAIVTSVNAVAAAHVALPGVASLVVPITKAAA